MLKKLLEDMRKDAEEAAAAYPNSESIAESSEAIEHCVDSFEATLKNLPVHLVALEIVELLFGKPCGAQDILLHGERSGKIAALIKEKLLD